MRDFRIELISTDLRSDFRFAIWEKGADRLDVAAEVDRQYRPLGFRVNHDAMTGILNQSELTERFGVDQDQL